MKLTMEWNWISVDERLPHDGAAVVAAITGRYPPDCPVGAQDFWLVLPMHFRTVHPVEDTDEVIENVFIDPDDVVRSPLGGSTEELVTHWSELPNLPGTDVPQIIGDGVAAALRAVSGD